MAEVKVMLIFAVLALICLFPGNRALTFREKASQVKLDAQWIDAKANDVVDLIFVMDRSGSVGGNFPKAKTFVKDFLDYFSIAPQHTQVGVVLFDNGVSNPLPLTHNNHKCKFMGQLERDVPNTVGGLTNAYAGLEFAVNLLRKNSRKNFGAFPVVVFITDGDYNVGGNPLPQVEALKREGALLIIITIGNNLRRKAEILGWASKDNRNQPMAFPIENFDQFAHLAHYIHKGSQTSKFLPIDDAECGNKCDKAGASASACVCDTLASRGQPTCGCDPGQHVKAINGKDGCVNCPLGFYQEEKNIFRSCKSCPKGQTTHAPRSADISQCVCGPGFWNPIDKSRNPHKGQCSPVTCQKDSPQLLDSHFIALSGSCQYTYGQSCNYECFRGFITAGVKTRTCQQSGKMDPPPAMCSALLCPIMPKVPHSTGWICLNQGRQVSGKYPYRTTCENHCNAGFLPRPDTNEFVICGLDNDRLTGKWSGSGLVCEPRKCTNLPEVLNGQYNQRDCSHPASDRTFGKVCSVSCNHGFIISEKVEWTCQDDGQWTNYDKTVRCKDITPPQILSCPQHLTVPNEENEGYAIVKLLPLDAIDNDGASTIDQTLHLQPAGSARIDEYPCNSKDCGETTFNLPIGTSTVNFTVSDRSGNSDSCIYQVTVQDVEPPQVVQCDGPDTKDGFIYSEDNVQYVDWKEPEFSDNSGLELKIYPTGSPGEYRVGRTWSFKYTATDTAGHTAQCEFSFKLTGIRCPQLHTPANGALVCDKLAFGIYCVPQCQRGLERLLPDHIRYTPNDYFCSTKGKWLPHDEVGDCAIRVPEDSNGGSPFDVLWFDGDCNDEHTKQSIIQTTLDALNNGGPSFTGQGWKDSQDKPLTVDDFEVFCGPKNESIIQIGRSKREVSYVQGLSATAKLFSGVVLN